MVFVDTECIVHYSFHVIEIDNCTNCSASARWLLTFELSCWKEFYVSSVSKSKMDLFHCLTVLCQLCHSQLCLHLLWTSARYLGKIFLVGLCQQHKQYPRVYIWYDQIRQITATWRVILGLTACIIFQSVSPVVHRFCFFWCIHQMYSATIAQSSSKYCGRGSLFRSLFPVSCFLVSLCGSAHAYALTMRL